MWKEKKERTYCKIRKIVIPLHSQNHKVPWMSGLVSGLQNRVRRFESARNLKKLRNREAFFVYLCLVAREYELLNKFLVESGGIA